MSYYLNAEPLGPPPSYPEGPAGTITKPLLPSTEESPSPPQQQTALSVLQGALAGASVFTVLELARYFLFG